MTKPKKHNNNNSKKNDQKKDQTTILENAKSTHDKIKINLENSQNLFQQYTDIQKEISQTLAMSKELITKFDKLHIDLVIANDNTLKFIDEIKQLISELETFKDLKESAELLESIQTNLKSMRGWVAKLYICASDIVEFSYHNLYIGKIDDTELSSFKVTTSFEAEKLSNNKKIYKHIYLLFQKGYLLAKTLETDLDPQFLQELEEKNITFKNIIECRKYIKSSQSAFSTDTKISNDQIAKMLGNLIQKVNNERYISVIELYDSILAREDIQNYPLLRLFLYMDNILLCSLIVSSKFHDSQTKNTYLKKLLACSHAISDKFKPNDMMNIFGIESYFPKNRIDFFNNTLLDIIQKYLVSNISKIDGKIDPETKLALLSQAKKSAQCAQLLNFAKELFSPENELEQTSIKEVEIDGKMEQIVFFDSSTKEEAPKKGADLLIDQFDLQIKESEKRIKEIEEQLAEQEELIEQAEKESSNAWDELYKECEEFEKRNAKKAPKLPALSLSTENNKAQEEKIEDENEIAEVGYYVSTAILSDAQLANLELHKAITLKHDKALILKLYINAKTKAESSKDYFQLSTTYMYMVHNYRKQGQDFLTQRTDLVNSWKEAFSNFKMALKFNNLANQSIEQFCLETAKNQDNPQKLGAYKMVCEAILFETQFIKDLIQEGKAKVEKRCAYLDYTRKIAKSQFEEKRGVGSWYNRPEKRDYDKIHGPGAWFRDKICVSARNRQTLIDELEDIHELEGDINQLIGKYLNFVDPKAFNLALQNEAEKNNNNNGSLKNSLSSQGRGRS